MKQWKIAYDFVSGFSAPVVENHYKLRCFPRESGVQKVLSMDYSVRESSWSTLGRDSFGNTYCAGCCVEPHESFSFSMHALIQRESGPEPEPLHISGLGMYRGFTFLTARGNGLLQLYNSIGREAGTAPLARAMLFMDASSRAISYLGGRTAFGTTAEEALEIGFGVCQDYAHIMLALCRLDGLTARYVAGAIPGEGVTHAWTEVLCDGCWTGFDPTHNRRTDDSYIVFSVGLDAGSASLNRGIFKNGAESGQSVHIIMEEA